MLVCTPISAHTWRQPGSPICIYHSSTQENTLWWKGSPGPLHPPPPPPHPGTITRLGNWALDFLPHSRKISICTPTPSFCVMFKVINHYISRYFVHLIFCISTTIRSRFISFSYIPCFWWPLIFLYDWHGKWPARPALDSPAVRWLRTDRPPYFDSDRLWQSEDCDITTLLHLCSL